MHFIDKLNTPGDHALMLTGRVGALEAVLTVPEESSSRYVAVLGHPHSLQGGSMSNKVVTTMARAFKELQIPSLRFNFRGVGRSEGVYDEGVGESEDMLALAQQWKQEKQNTRFLFAGFSFGSYVAYRAAAQCAHDLLITDLLITIAPPVHHYDYREFKQPNPWLIVQGMEDEVVPAQLVLDFAQQSQPEIPVLEYADTGHFFHGKLIELKSQLIEYLQTQVLSV